MNTPAEALARLLETLDRMEVRYQVGGSVASSSHGVPRTTLGIDLVVDFRPDQIETFVAELHGEFYADAAFIKESFAHGRAANLIQLGTAWKFDLFLLGQDAYSRTALGWRSFRAIRPDGKPPIECAVATPEGTILRKLEWYGGWARELKVDDLLENLLTEAAL